MRLNIYSARHYESDDLLYDGFQDATGIPVNVIEGEGPELLARMRAEGKNSPADVFLTVDAGNLWLAEKENLFQPVQSKMLGRRASPPRCRNPKNLWFGFSTRARMIFVNAARVDPKLVQTYKSLADPRLKGKICMRSSSAIYNLSLMGALIAHWGPQKAEQWAKGVVANFARPPQGADTTLLQSVAAGECAVTLANHYYYVRLETSKVRGEQDAAKKLTPIFPDQDGSGHACQYLRRRSDGVRAAQGERDQVPRIHGERQGAEHRRQRQLRISRRRHRRRARKSLRRSASSRSIR